MNFQLEAGRIEIQHNEHASFSSFECFDFEFKLHNKQQQNLGNMSHGQVVREGTKSMNAMENVWVM